MGKCEIDKNLLPIKLHYFLINGAHAGVIPFIPVYGEQLGLSAGAVGIILALLSCLTVVSKSAFGGVVDRFQKLHQVILFLVLLDVAADLGLSFIPKPYQKPLNNTASNVFCHGRNAYIRDFGESACFEQVELRNNCISVCALCKNNSVSCIASYNESSEIPVGIFNDSENVLGKCLLNKVEKEKCTDACFDGSELCENVIGTNPTLQVWLLGLFACLIFTSNGAIVSLTDAACYNVLGDQPQNFGKQRMWGTVGWGLFAFFTGYLNQVFTGTSKIYSYSSGFYMMVVLFAIDLIVVRMLQLKNVTLSKNICKDVGRILVKPKILLFIMAMFGIGIVTGISRSYLYWYLRTTLGASQLVLGCTAGIQCFFGELPFFFFSGLIIRKLGHINTFTMSFLAYGLKLLSHSFLFNPWWALPIELLQGPCFGSFYSAMTSYSKTISPKGAEATMQGIVSGTFEGLGVATGSLLCGFSINNFGGRQTFFWIGLLSLCAGIIHWLVHLVVGCKNRIIRNFINLHISATVVTVAVC